MAADIITNILVQFTLSNVRLAAGIFVVAFLLVRGAYKLGIMGEQAQEDKLRKGYARATRLADSLAQKGMPFREAHEKVGKLIRALQKEGKYLEDLSEKELAAELGKL